MRRPRLFAVVSAVLCAVFSISADAHGVQQYINGKWFDGEKFVERTMYSVQGLLQETSDAAADATIDLSGMYVIPPFADAHDHRFADGMNVAEQINESLAAGIFYFRNPNNTRRLTARARTLVNHPESVEVLYANGGLTGPGGHPVQIYQRIASHLGIPQKELDGEAYFTITSAADLNRRWPALLEGRPDFIKAYLFESEHHESRKGDAGYIGRRGLDPVLLPRIVEMAHAAGLRVVVHIESAHDFRVAVGAGADELAHLPLERITAEDAKTAAARGTVIQTTTLSHRPTSHVSDLDAVNRHNLDLLFGAGVPVVLGSDNGQQNVIDEAENLLRLGVADSMQLLTMLTETTPRSIFPDRKIGRLRGGYEASFLVLPGDPLLDLGNLRKVVHRVKMGHLLEVSRAEKKPGVAGILMHITMSGGVEDAIAEYQRLKEIEPERYDYSEAQLNALGYGLLRAERVDEAVAIFRFNARLFPQSSNVFDSLGEALWKKGEREQAKASYLKALELNPQNENAAKMLAEIERAPSENGP